MTTVAGCATRRRCRAVVASIDPLVRGAEPELCQVSASMVSVSGCRSTPFSGHQTPHRVDAVLDWPSFVVNAGESNRASKKGHVVVGQGFHF